MLASAQHCKCKWLLKIDLKDFFHSITERDAFKFFVQCGYSKLLSLELARLVTVGGDPMSHPLEPTGKEWQVIKRYRSSDLGFLPQGAPTSPMLSNLIMFDLDRQMHELATSQGFTYTRYADDIAFSTSNHSSLKQLQKLRRSAEAIFSRHGLQESHQRCSFSGPGSRRIVLGLLVDGANPRIPSDYKDAILQHLYFLNSKDHGPKKHAENRRMSVSGLYNHLKGRVSWCARVEPEFGRSCWEIFNAIPWPILDRHKKLGKSGS